MSFLSEIEGLVAGDIGEALHSFASRLYPVCRSITGNGTRATLKEIGAHIPLDVSEVPTGTSIFDWTVPREWNIHDAFIRPVGSDQRIVDFRECNLHVMSYSSPVRRVMSLTELRPHLFTIPEHPDWIPYRTSYYQNNWGFCLSDNQFLALEEGDYEVCIDSTLEDGFLTYGECYVPGQSADEVLISSHVCHPSLANDNLSGIAVSAFLARCVARRDNHYSYRFIFAPGTIGAITWLARNQEIAERIRHGLVLTCIGDSGGFHYKKSRRGNAEIDRAAAHVLGHTGESAEILDFTPFGYDERQYCSPGFNLPVGCLMRSVWGNFPEYHTSADNLRFILPSRLAGSLRACARILDVLEGNHRYLNTNPYCEPQMGRRNLYRSAGEETATKEISARLWVLNLSDGDHSLLDIAEKSGLPFSVINDAARLLCRSGLLTAIAEKDTRPA